MRFGGVILHPDLRRRKLRPKSRNAAWRKRRKRKRSASWLNTGWVESATFGVIRGVLKNKGYGHPCPLTSARGRERKSLSLRRILNTLCVGYFQEESEAAQAAAAPAWSDDIAWDEAVTAAMAMPPQEEETQLDQEARVLKSVLEADIVPDSKIIKVCCVESRV